MRGDRCVSNCWCRDAFISRNSPLGGKRIVSEGRGGTLSTTDRGREGGWLNSLISGPWTDPLTDTEAFSSCWREENAGCLLCSDPPDTTHQKSKKLQEQFYLSCSISASLACSQPCKEDLMSLISMSILHKHEINAESSRIRQDYYQICPSYGFYFITRKFWLMVSLKSISAWN